MKDKSPLVSIIAVCYNHSEYAVELLDSLMQQTYKNLQLIIMDDCSKDNSVEVIQNWIEQNNVDCQFFPHQKNQGLTKTLNEALSYVKGDFCQIIACDDVMMPEKIEQNLDVFKKHGEKVALVYSDSVCINEHSEITDQSYFKKYGREEAPKDHFKTFLRSPWINAPTAIMRTAAVKEAGGYNEDLSFEDLDMWLKLSHKYEVVRMDEKLVKYRILSNSFSRSIAFQTRIEKERMLIISKWYGIAEVYDREIDKTMSHLIELLMLKDEATRSQLYKKWRIDRSWYMLYLYLMALIFIKVSTATKIKKRLYAR